MLVICPGYAKYKETCDAHRCTHRGVHDEHRDGSISCLKLPCGFIEDEHNVAGVTCEQANPCCNRRPK